VALGSDIAMTSTIARAPGSGKGCAPASRRPPSGPAVPGCLPGGRSGPVRIVQGATIGAARESAAAIAGRLEGSRSAVSVGESPVISREVVAFTETHGDDSPA